MLSTRKKELPQTLSVIRWHGHVLRIVANQNNLTDKDCYALIILYCLQMDRNELIKATTFCKYIYETYLVALKRLHRLKKAGFTENTPFWNVTNRGEYVVRTYMIEMSRILNDTPLSKWRKIKAGSSQALYLRKHNTKGTKLY